MAFNEKHKRLRSLISHTLVEAMQHMGRNVEPEDRVDVKIVSDLLVVLAYVDPEESEKIRDTILLLDARDKLNADRDGKDGA